MRTQQITLDSLPRTAHQEWQRQAAQGMAASRQTFREWCMDDQRTPSPRADSNAAKVAWLMGMQGKAYAFRLRAVLWLRPASVRNMCE